jgi:cell wall-associated NlpC family hydrolase
MQLNCYRNFSCFTIKKGGYNLNKKIVSAVIAMAFIFTANFTAVKADLASDKARLQEIQAQRSELETKITKMDNQIETLMSQISSNKESIAVKETEITLAQADVIKAEKDLKAEQLLYQERIRAMYISGTSSSTIEILLDSKSFDDLMSRAENITRVMKYNIGIINGFNEKKAVLDSKKAALEVEKNALVSLQQDSEQKLTELSTQKTDQATLISQLKAQERQYGSQIAAAEAAALAAAKAEIEKAKAEAAALLASANESRGPSSSSSTSTSTGTSSSSSSSTTGSTNTNTSTSTAGSAAASGSSSYSADAVISYASNFLGVPYVWGGTTPAGFDCSGFVKYVYAHFGITLPRVAADQQKVGTYVSRADLKPGDLVFFGEPAHHVGLYVGNGYMIHAPHTGDVVKIAPLNSDFSNGRRLK